MILTELFFQFSQQTRPGDGPWWSRHHGAVKSREHG